jgi:hypothetical protein
MVVAAAAGVTACLDGAGVSPDPQFAVGNGGAARPGHATGAVEIVWPGGKGKEIPPGEEKLAFAEFEAHPATDVKPARGSFTYRVLNADSSDHRTIVATVTAAYVSDLEPKAWFVGLVESDTKICSGGGGDCDGHDGGDGGCSGHDGSDGGCDGHDGTNGGCDGHDGTDGGCSGGGSGGSDGSTGGPPDNTGGSGGGCSDGGETGGCDGHDGTDGTDGGCSDGGETGGCDGHDGTDGTDGGCTGHDGTDGGCDGHDGGDGGCSGGGGHSGGGSVPGKESRVGQVVVVKVHDRSSPGTPSDGSPGDGVTWKWFTLESWAWQTTEEPSLPLLGVIEEWPHLCKKQIIGGNLVVHMPTAP